MLGDELPGRRATAAMLFALLASGCGKAPGLAAASQASAAQAQTGEEAAQGQATQTDVPLNADDVAFYLQVMRAAAERARHPTAADRQAQSRASEIANQANAGKTAMLTSADQEALMRAMLLQGQADRLIVEERHLDSARYERIASAIEEVVPDPAGAFGSGDAEGAPSTPSPRQREALAVEAKNAELLKPFVPEIQKLLAVVRHPPASGGT
jgi:hypothetical protein